jgi:hypothetical protein
MKFSWVLGSTSIPQDRYSIYSSWWHNRNRIDLATSNDRFGWGNTLNIHRLPCPVETIGCLGKTAGTAPLSMIFVGMFTKKIHEELVNSEYSETELWDYCEMGCIQCSEVTCQNYYNTNCGYMVLIYKIHYYKYIERPVPTNFSQRSWLKYWGLENKCVISIPVLTIWTTYRPDNTQGEIKIDRK